MPLFALGSSFWAAQAAWATDIIGIQPAALDQPQINAAIRYPSTTGTLNDPLFADFGGGTRAFNVTAFLDTGASGVLLSNETASFLGDLYNPGVETASYNNKPVVYQDVGVAGSDNFRVSVPVQVSIGAFNTANVDNVANAEQQLSDSNPASFQGIDLSYYKHTTGTIRAQVGPLNTADPNDPGDNPLLEDLDVFGMPVMKGKVVVMDPKPVENIISGNIDNGFQMKTHVYNPGTAFNPATADDDPGIPKTTRTIKLSYGSFNEFTRTGTLEGDGSVAPLPADQVATYQPTLEHNPFIGPNPINPAGDTTPPVKVSFNGQSATGSFLLDTGSAASMISTSLASKLNVRYVAGTQGTDNPQLESFDPKNPSAPGTAIDNQFQLSIGGIGGTTKVAGFFLSSMLVKTMQGSVTNDNDPNHFNFVQAPVLVSDITVQNPDTQRTLTLDGIFGMNNLVASIFVSENGGIIPDFSDLTPGAFDWVVFDEPNGELKLRPRLSGDSNRDGIVDFNDLVKLAQSYNSELQSDFWANGDFNGDGVVDFNDLVMLAQHYNDPNAADGVIDLPHYQFDIGLGAAAAGVPEPGGLMLMGGAMVALGRRRRR
ncbi:MAG TPA: aspartyl protease family protein [Tepidisphaeraceae bacterium]